MRYKLSPLLLTTLVLSGHTFADTQPDPTEARIKEHVQSWIDIEVVSNDSIIQKMVFDCKFYNATPVMKTPDGGESSTGSYRFYSQGETLGSMTEPYTTQVLPELTQCLKPDFVVTNRDQAQLLFEAIKTVYTNNSMFDDNYPKELIQKNNGWNYIDGEIFDDKKGYVVETDAKGKVIKIVRSLNL